MADPFAPIAGAAHKLKVKASARESAWRAILPVPSDAPKAPEAHGKLGKPVARWEYRDAVGALLGHVLRFEDGEGEKQFRPLVLFKNATSGAISWRWESWPQPRPLYGLDLLAQQPSAPVIVTEGEKAADAARRLLPDYVVVTSPNGSKSARKADWSALRGRAVTIWPDADEPGAAYALTVAELVAEAGAKSVATLALPPEVKSGWDAADAEKEGWTGERAAALVAAANSASKDDRTASRGRRRPPQRDSLMHLVEYCELWHSPDKDAYVTFKVGAHFESWPVRSRDFSHWLRVRAYEEMHLAPGAQAFEDALRQIEAQAVAYGPKRTPWRRVGSRDNRLYLDLCDDAWRVVEIRPDGWDVLDRHDAPFIRSSAMRALPEPIAGESIDVLRNFANVEDEASFTLVVAWLLASLRDRGPYPILVVNGEQGTGKSNFARMLRSLVDPNKAAVSRPPRESRDLIATADMCHVISYDNLSHIEKWLADDLCTLATVGGVMARALNTDRELIVFDAVRPIMLNGIPMLTRQADLASRAIAVRLRPIPESERRPEDELTVEWAKAQPMVLGALLDGLSRGLRDIATTKLESSPRMADAAKWATACEPGLGWERGTVLQAYMANQKDLAESAFEADPVATVIADFAQKNNGDIWRGTPTELLNELNQIASETMKRLKTWPTSAQGLGNNIERAKPLLRERGIIVERKHSSERWITIAMAA